MSVEREKTIKTADSLIIAIKDGYIPTSRGCIQIMKLLLQLLELIDPQKDKA